MPPLVMLRMMGLNVLLFAGETVVVNEEFSMVQLMFYPCNVCSSVTFSFLFHSTYNLDQGRCKNIGCASFCFKNFSS